MGASQSQPLRNQLENYKILSRNVESSTTHLSHKETDKQYILRESTNNEQQMYKKILNEHKMRQGINDEHLIHLCKYEGKEFDHLCSNIYKVYSIWEYPMRSLRDQVNERVYQNRKFEEKQIWSILASSIFALNALQKNKIKHECLSTKTILLDYNGIVKVSDPLALGIPTNLDIINRNRNAQSTYLSPEQCEALQAKGNYNNPYRSDVWALGMIILQCGLLQSLSSCYKDQYQRIDYQLLENKLQQFGSEYGEELRVFVSNMLRPESKQRPDWIDLAQYARKFQKNTSAMNSSQKQQSQLSNMKFNLSPPSREDQSLSFISPPSLSKNPPPVSDPLSKPNQIGASNERHTNYQNPIINVNQPINAMTNGMTGPSQLPLTSKMQFGPAFSVPPPSSMYQQYSATPQQYRVPATNTMTFTSNFNQSTSFQPLHRPTQYSVGTNSLIGTFVTTQGNLFPNPNSTTNTNTNISTNPYFNSNNGGFGGTVNGFKSIYTPNPTGQFGKPQPWKKFINNEKQQTEYLSFNRPAVYMENKGVLQSKSPALSKTSPNTSFSGYQGSGYQGSVSGYQPGANGFKPTSYLESGKDILQNKNQYVSPVYSKQGESLFTPPSLFQLLAQPKSPLPQTYQKQKTSNFNNFNTITNINTTNSGGKAAVNNLDFVYGASTTSNYYLNSNANTSPGVHSYSNYQAFNRSDGIGSSLKQYKPSQQGSKNQQAGPQLVTSGPSAVPTQSLQQINTVESNVNLNTAMEAKISQLISQPYSDKNANMGNMNSANKNVSDGHEQNGNSHQRNHGEDGDLSSRSINRNMNEDSTQSRAQFVVETFKQGSRYQGYKIRDARHGQGKFYYQDGGMYDGNWSRNKMDGFGSLYYQSGELAYQGMWKQDQFQGKGKLFNEYPYALDHQFNYENFDQIDEFWSYYQGDFVEDFKKGKGKLMLSNGQYFQGTFNNDMVEGPGTFYCRNGQIIKGLWRQNHLISQ